MPNQNVDKAAVFTEADELLFRGDAEGALRVLRKLARDCGYCEEWHDRMGRCYWEKSQEKPVAGGRLTFGHHPYGKSRRELQRDAGRHWFYSPRNDPPSCMARSLWVEEYAGNLLHFHWMAKPTGPSLPIPSWDPEFPLPDKFSDPVVQQRLRELHERLKAAAANDPKLAEQLEHGRAIYREERKLLESPKERAEIERHIRNIKPIALLYHVLFSLTWNLSCLIVFIGVSGLFLLGLFGVFKFFLGK